MTTELVRNHTPAQPPVAARRRSAAPPVDILSTDSGFTIRADVPGATREGLSLEVDDGRLHLKAETTEREYGTLLSGPRNGVVWERSFALPRGVDLDAIDATLDAGVLTVTLPLAAEVAPRRIAVRTSGN